MQINSYKNDYQNKKIEDERQQDRSENQQATETRDQYMGQSNLNKYYLKQ